MTEKRFTIMVDDENNVHILDNNIDIGQYNLCNLLNGLAEENQALKQFKEQVFNLIDKKLEENKELDGVDTAMYYANKGTLNELKGELRE